MEYEEIKFVNINAKYSEESNVEQDLVNNDNDAENADI